MDVNDKFWLYFNLEVDEGLGLEKGLPSGNEEMIVKGVVATTRRDFDGQILKPSGFDLSYFLNYGFINWNHHAKGNPQAIIGEPIEAKIEDDKFLIKARLYKDNPLAMATYILAKSLEKGGGSRKLAFSLEGNILEMNPNDKTIVERAMITNVAITPSPKNYDSYLSLEKAYDFGNKGMIIDTIDKCGGGNICVNDNMKIIIEKSVDSTLKVATLGQPIDSDSDIQYQSAVDIIGIAINSGVLDKEDLIKGFANSRLNDTPIHNKTGLEIKDKLRFVEQINLAKMVSCRNDILRFRKSILIEPEEGLSDEDWRLRGLSVDVVGNPELLRIYSYKQMYESLEAQSSDNKYLSVNIGVNEEVSKERFDSVRKKMRQYNGLVERIINMCVDNAYIHTMISNLDDKSVVSISNATASELGF